MKIYSSLSILFVMLFNSCMSTGYREYFPIYPNGRSFVKCPDSLTEQHQANIEKVFLYYNVSFKKDQNRIFYKGPIEEELLWNYTLKANDTTWLNTHF